MLSVIPSVGLCKLQKCHMSQINWKRNILMVALLLTIPCTDLQHCNNNTQGSIVIKWKKKTQRCF